MSLKRSGVIQTTAVATGVSIKTVNYIHTEFTSQDGDLLTPLKRYSTSHVCNNPNDVLTEKLFVGWSMISICTKSTLHWLQSWKGKGGMWVSRREILSVESVERKGV